MFVNIRKYWAHFEYTMRHKWFVFIECCKMGIPVQGIFHDMSKFTIKEFVPYALFFFDENGKKIDGIRDKTGAYNPLATGNSSFESAWFWHQARNKHHWQYWISLGDHCSYSAIEIPRKYVLEMIADWRGAGMAQSTPNVLKWYESSKDKMVLHIETRKMIEQILEYGR